MLQPRARCATESLFSLVPGPGTVDSQGQIEFLRCYATLKTKSQTKFYLEFHSSCLESKSLLNLLWVGAARLFLTNAFSLMVLCPISLPWEGLMDGPQCGGMGGQRRGLQGEVQGDTQLWCTDASP